METSETPLAQSDVLVCPGVQSGWSAGSTSPAGEAVSSRRSSTALGDPETASHRTPSRSHARETSLRVGSNGNATTDPGVVQVVMLGGGGQGYFHGFPGHRVRCLRVHCSVQHVHPLPDDGHQLQLVSVRVPVLSVTTVVTAPRVSRPEAGAATPRVEPAGGQRPRGAR